MAVAPESPTKNPEELAEVSTVALYAYGPKCTTFSMAKTQSYTTYLNMLNTCQ